MSLPISIQRLGYRVAYRVLQAVWFVARPHKLGVKCVISDNGRVLLVRHTYGNRQWDLPGGSVKRHEAPLSAAGREMDEELGIVSAQWREVGTLSTLLDHRRDTMHCFHTELSDPELTVARGELDTVRWFARGELPRPRSRYVDTILALSFDGPR